MNATNTTLVPTAALWDFFGNPPLLNTAATQEGPCSLCGTNSPLVAAKSVVSDNFTDWDRHPPNPHWCEPCAWAHTVPELRHHSWSISGEQCARLNGPDLFSILSEPLNPATALTIPISRHKHLVPYASAGLIATDDTTLGWSARQAERLRLMARLRGYGFTEPSLVAMAPRWDTINSLSKADAHDTLCHWSDLNAWRSNPLLMKIGLLATRRPNTE